MYEEIHHNARFGMQYHNLWLISSHSRSYYSCPLFTFYALSQIYFSYLPGGHLYKITDTAISDDDYLH